jgi:RNA polymerase sigma-70 factor (ECF subfamily)
MRLQPNPATSDDMTLAVAVAQTRAGLTDPLTQIMRAHNQRLFRIARGVLRDNAEAEDIVQDTFIKAFTNADTLLDNTKIAAWLGKIALNLARDRLRQNVRRNRLIDIPENLDVIPINRAFQEDADRQSSPERLTAMGDIRRLIETEIDSLPDGFREVFIMREVEQMSVQATAAMLELPANTVKTRLYRAKLLLRKGLEDHLNAQSLNAFPFGGVHCARTTDAVITHFQQQGV